jgi:D-ribose pyranose/furanose isomerase RbsD
VLDEYDALGAIEFLRSAGLSVPQDSALVDDLPTVLQVLDAIRPNFVIGQVTMAREFCLAQPRPLRSALARKR